MFELCSILNGKSVIAPKKLALSDYRLFCYLGMIVTENKSERQAGKKALH